LNSFCGHMLALVLALLSCRAAFSQAAKISVAALSGKTGKPLAHQRLLVFGGATQDDVRLEKNFFDLMTDNNGIAILSVDPIKIKLVQVWVKSQALCSTNLPIFNVSQIESSGLASSNTCSSFTRDLVPMQLVVFARPKTLREKMQQ
jgi:hypothetical protein